MDFLKALDLAVSVIREQRDLDEIYLYELDSEVQVYLRDCEGSLQFMSDEPIAKQVYLDSFLDKRLRSTYLSLKVIFSCEWEVRGCKREHFRAIALRGKTKEVFIDYATVGKEEVADA